MAHFFDGDSMLHVFRISNGQLFYFNKWMHTDRFKYEQMYKKVLFHRVGELFNFLGILKVGVEKVKTILGLIPELDLLRNG